MKVENIESSFWEKEHFRRQSEFDRLTQTPSEFATQCAGMLKPGCRILELGSGRGRDAAYFVRSLGASVVTVDIAPNALAFMANDYPGEITRIQRVNATNGCLPFVHRHGLFDAVYARSALYMSDERFLAFLLLAKTILSPRGFVMLEGKTTDSKDIQRSKSVGESLVIDSVGHLRRVWGASDTLLQIVRAGLTLVSYGYREELWEQKRKTFLHMICQAFIPKGTINQNSL